MKIIVGLGNPGKKYLWTRHNLGFMLIDAITQNSKFQNKYKSQIQKTEIEGEQVLLAKPQTFMNLSGKAILEILNFYKISLDDLLVIHDDKDQAFGKIKFQKSRGDGGHNGIKNIHQELQSPDYCRLKMGVTSTSKSASKDKTEKQEKTSLPHEIWPHKPLKMEDTFLSSDMEDLKPRPDTARFVLSPFNKTEKQNLPDFLEQGRKAVYCFVQKGYEVAANQFNSQIIK